MDIKKIECSGFLLKDHKENLSDFAYLSLNIALKSFASTYKSFFNGHEGVIDFLSKNQTYENRDYPDQYIMNAVETITHLHHFFELVIKEVLRNEHQLLATNANNKPLILAKLLKNIPVDDDDASKLSSIEFKIALERVCALIDNNLIDRQFHFLKDYNSFLTMLNNLRNRLLHRGMFVLEYEALDWLMIKYAVPLIKEITSRKLFVIKAIRYDWKFKPIVCGISPLDLLIECNTGKTYDIKKVALIKEMVRSAFENPIEQRNNYIPIANTVIDFKSQQKTKVQIELAEFMFNNRDEYVYDKMINEIADCPVCGIKTLLIFYDYKDDLLIETYNYKVKCTCCSFEINNEIDVLNDPSLKIRNFWVR